MTHLIHCHSALLMVLTLLVGIPTLQAQNRPSAPAYTSETWPPARQLVWAHPGEGGAFDDVSNWRNADGSPATTIPDRNTDILLPAADTPYDVHGNRLCQVRHVTIEANGRISGSHRNELEIWGNCWVKPEGRIAYISVRGDRHTFFRVDEAEFPNEKNRKMVEFSKSIPLNKSSRTHICHKFQVLKVGSASVEFIGNMGVSDEVMLQHGRMIINDGFRYSGSTGKGAFEIYDGGILELQSGAQLAPFTGSNRKAVFNVNVYRNGSIQAGSPERPLTRDAYLLLGFEENDVPGRTGLYAALGSMIRVYTADPKKARLVISSITSDPDFRDGKGLPVGDPDEKAAGNKGIAMQLAGDVDFSNVVLDYVSEKGLALGEALDRSQWKNVTYGPHCAVAPDQLFAGLEIDANTYYHARNDQDSEYGLTVRAVEDMRAYLEASDPFRLKTLPPNTELRANTGTKGGNRSLDTPAAVVFTEPVEVTIQARVPGARIRYTLDGSEPTKTSPQYNGPIRLERTTRLTAKAYKTGVGFSPTFTTTYVIER